MFIKAQNLQSGQKISTFGRIETVQSVHVDGSTVMVFIAEESANPFVSSTFNTYSLTTDVEVV